MEKVLNQEEIDAMVRAARGTGSSQSRTTRTVRPWDVRQAGQIGREQVKAISFLHESFARNLTHSLGAYLRVVFEAGLVSAEHLTYREFLARIPEITYLASCQLRPMEMTALLQMDLAIAFPMIDLLLGGEGRSGGLVREITEIEEQILESVVRIVFRELRIAWQAIALEFIFEQRQQPAQAQRIMAPEEKTLSLSFEITMPDTRGTLNLAVPAVASNALLRKISAEWTYQKRRGPAEAKARIKQRLLDCPFDLDLEVVDIHLPLKKLVGLQPGDTLELPHRADALARLRIGEVDLFHSLAVRHGEKCATRLIERMHVRPDRKGQ